MYFQRMIRLSAVACVLSATMTSCKPKTPAQKIEDKAEDVGHEINQGVERAKENVQDAPN